MSSAAVFSPHRFTPLPCRASGRRGVSHRPPSARLRGRLRRDACRRRRAHRHPRPTPPVARSRDCSPRENRSQMRLIGRGEGPGPLASGLWLGILAIGAGSGRRHGQRLADGSFRTSPFARLSDCITIGGGAWRPAAKVGDLPLRIARLQRILHRTTRRDLSKGHSLQAACARL
jgi:hypothetical protein